MDMQRVSRRKEQDRAESSPPVPVRRMEPAEFRRLGLLQEVNRQFLHPLGLALEMQIGGGTGFFYRVDRGGQVESLDLCELTIEEIQELVIDDAQIAKLIHDLAQTVCLAPEHFGRVWDYRDDPEGLAFAEPVTGEAAAYVRELRESHRPAREKLFGGDDVQPLGFTPPPAEPAE